MRPVGGWPLVISSGVQSLPPTRVRKSTQSPPQYGGELLRQVERLVAEPSDSRVRVPRSVENSPIFSTRTRSPYFSPKSAMAPAATASS